jgi:hypothetical protein
VLWQYCRGLDIIALKRGGGYHSENLALQLAISQMTGSPHKWRDVAWKRAIADGAKDAIAYFMPDLASDMDTSREVTCITGMELPVKDSDSDKGMLVSDVFLNVPVKGEEDWSVACLAEQQDADEKGERGTRGFAARMFDSLVRLMASRPGLQAGLRGLPCTLAAPKTLIFIQSRVTAWKRRSNSERATSPATGWRNCGMTSGPSHA